MKFFIDTANLDEIAEAKSWGCLAGVTTNPSLYAKTGGKLADFEPHMLKIAELCEGLPVSAESTATTAEGMIEEGKRLAALAPNIGNNVNQIAEVANSSGSVYQKDIEDLQKEFKYFRSVMKNYLFEISPTYIS